jgi:pimeloyl-ACP methyl ester carboxylesterase
MALPILLVPGLTCTSEVWSHQLAPLWSRGPVTVAHHMEGETIAEIARAVLLSAPPRFALGGISMGGYIAFEIWRQAPERVLGLAFVDTSSRPDAPETTERRRAAMALARECKFTQVVANAFPFAVHPDHQDDATLRGLHTRMALSVGVEVYLRQQEAIIGRADSRPDLAGITVPTTVIVGERDLLTPPELAKEIADGIPGASLVSIPGAGHMALAEQPLAVNAALFAWMDRVAAR